MASNSSKTAIKPPLQAIYEVWIRDRFAQAGYTSQCGPANPMGYSERCLIQVVHMYVATGCGDADEFFLCIMVPGNACETSVVRSSTYAYTLLRHCPQTRLMGGSHRRNNEPRPFPLRVQMRHRGPPLPRIFKLIRRGLCCRVLTTHILLDKPQSIPPVIKTMFDS